MTDTHTPFEDYRKNWNIVSVTMTIRQNQLRNIAKKLLRVLLYQCKARGRGDGGNVVSRHEVGRYKND